MDGVTSGGLAERYFWSRHANPASVSTMVAAFPMLVLAIYRRNRPLLVGTLLAVALNPLLLSPPDDDGAWATRVVLGERVGLERKSPLWAETAFVLACSPVYLFTLRAAANRRPIRTVAGTTASMVLMLLFFRRMVRLYEEASNRRPGEL
jgi:hypothetical protein